MSSPGDEGFGPLASNYDAWIGWEPRLRRELPFLLDSFPQAGSTALPEVHGVCDIGCGTGAHAIALAAAGIQVTGLDQSPAMLEAAGAAEEQARRSGRLPEHASLTWVQGDVTDPEVMRHRWFRGVLALGNTLLALGEESKILLGLRSMSRMVAPGGTLLLQYLNGSKIRRQDRLVIKTAPAAAGRLEIWLRHHFQAGGEIYFHSYVLHPAGDEWTAEVNGGWMMDLTRERIHSLLEADFDRVEFFDGLSGKPFSLEDSDSIGVRASGRR